jgi:hypothetical protein
MWVFIELKFTEYRNTRYCLHRALVGIRKNINQIRDFTKCINSKLGLQCSFNLYSSLQVTDKVSHPDTTGRVVTVKFEKEWYYTQWQSRESSVYVEITHHRSLTFTEMVTAVQNFCLYERNPRQLIIKLTLLPVGTSYALCEIQQTGMETNQSRCWKEMQQRCKCKALIQNGIVQLNWKMLVCGSIARIFWSGW